MRVKINCLNRYAINADGSKKYNSDIVDDKTNFSEFGVISTTPISDDNLKTLTSNRCCTILTDSSGLSGVSSTSGIYCGFLHFTQTTDQAFQLVFTFNTGKIYYRSYYGSWTSWTSLN